MNDSTTSTDHDKKLLQKCPTGIKGLDSIIFGGLPRGRPTLVCGTPGCGKTLLAMEFLVRGAMQYDEAGVFVTFEETTLELKQNVHSFGYDLDDLIARKKLSIDYVYVERSEIDETGEYDLEGLFVRLGYAIDSVGAKRVVLDTIETLFSGLANTGILRAELRRLFRWLKDKGVTAVITAERGDGALTRNGLEEYVSDCVILLDHRIHDQISTRRMRVVKYRGSMHETNEFPFLIEPDGITVMPITSVGLNHLASEERISTGVDSLDAMMGGKGYYRTSSILISGTAGTGKTTLAAHFADAACARGEPCLFFAFEESPDQLVRNMRSIGLNLRPWIDQNLLIVHAVRPTLYGLERHLTTMYSMTQRFHPRAIIVDPVTNFLSAGSGPDVKSMLVRLIDFLKTKGVTSVFTSLTLGGEAESRTDAAISSLMDTWLLLLDVERDYERSGTISVLKSRGMSHSRKVRSFRFTDTGIDLGEADLHRRQHEQRGNIEGGSR